MKKYLYLLSFSLGFLQSIHGSDAAKIATWNSKAQIAINNATTASPAQETWLLNLLATIKPTPPQATADQAKTDQATAELAYKKILKATTYIERIAAQNTAIASLQNQITSIQNQIISIGNTIKQDNILIKKLMQPIS